jgi:hypothetical protein
MILAHIAIPLILCKLFPLNLLALLLGSGAPNFDAIPTLIRKKTPKNAVAEFHAGSILHTPIFYIVILPVVWSIATVIRNGDYFFGLSIAISFSLGGIIHVVMECLDEKGRMLLYPLSKKFYRIYVFPYDFWTYLTSKKTLALEAIFTVLSAVLVLFK